MLQEATIGTTRLMLTDIRGVNGFHLPGFAVGVQI
jgi:hypothetical protein